MAWMHAILLRTFSSVFNQQYDYKKTQTFVGRKLIFDLIDSQYVYILQV